MINMDTCPCFQKLELFNALENTKTTSVNEHLMNTYFYQI